jgi:trk system potassium uptake protein TrkA
MYVLVAGGGHMGTHLVGRLVAHGHETAVIDASQEVTDRIFNEQGVVVFTGSATDMDVLERAGIKRADVAVAMMGRDADNLAFCLLSRYYGVPRVLARMLNPQYEVPYRLVGATKVHSEADIIVNSFLTSIEYPAIGALLQVGRSDIVAFDVRIPPGSPVAGLKVSEIVRREGFPRNSVFIAVESQSGEVEVTEGRTVIGAGANVIMAARKPDLSQVLRFLTTTEAGAPGAEESDAVEALSLVGFLSGVAREDLTSLAVGARFEKRDVGAVVYQAGDPGDRLYVLSRGSVELVSPGGGLTVLRAPGYFGETSALVGHKRDHTARVREECDLLALDGSTLRAVMLRNPFLALELAKSLGERPAPDGTGTP